MSNINPGTLIPLLMAILAGGLGCALIVISWRKKRSGPITGSWLPVQGTVISSEVKEHRPVNANDSNKTVFSPVVHYQYNCSGRLLSGFRVTFDTVEYSRTKAEQIAGQYVPGNPVTVYYDPTHPDQAVLERSRNNYLTVFMAGVISLVLGITSFCMALLIFWLGNSVH